ncbi:hypothetical protein EW145_g2745 [Phellinidium pouzarii]|uniref:40S ribosomal protein S23 n=1 Tax=Phellinidium pouzarii TaxID=167371 RepID=A0A4S4LA76_9AGAM|nr:hypothetical protein EW145_g2745 [Phellinidium pouzarii]
MTDDKVDDGTIRYFHHGRFRVAGGVLPDAITAYQTFGNAANPCIVFPTCYGGKLDVFFAVEHCKSSSYLNLDYHDDSQPSPHNGPYFPVVSYEDNIRAQHAVLTKVLGIQKLYSVIGFIAICGSARTSPHNICFLEGPKAALIASKDFDNGHYKSLPQFGIRAFGRVYSAWAYGQTWFRNHGYLQDGKRVFPDLDSFLREDWEAGFLSGWDANDLITLLHTWQTGDISLIRNEGNFGACLTSIEAQGLIMPSKTDLYFPPEDSVAELSFLKNAKLVVIDSVWGHMAGGGSNARDNDFLTNELSLSSLDPLLGQRTWMTLDNAETAGGVLPNAITAYRTYGNPENPCIVFPTCYGAKMRLGSQDYLVGENKALDLKKYYVVTFALFSNGEVLSSSPSNTSQPHNGPYFPAVSYQDNIRAQHAVLTKKLGVKQLYCVVETALIILFRAKAYHWAAMYPDFVEKFIAICSSARTSPHNKCFLEGPKAALVASKDFSGGHYTSTPYHGIRAFARVYSAWAYGQTWFRERKYLFDGLFPDLDAWLYEKWEGPYCANWDANDMLGILHTWQNGDISQGGDLEAALKSIKAKALIMPCKTDLYFPPEDSELEVSHLKDAQLVIIPSVWGHVANKPRGLQAARKLRNDRRENRWADKAYKKRALGNIYKTSPTGGSSHAKGIVLEKVGVEAKQPNSAIRKCVRVQLIKNGKKVTAFVPNDGCLNFVDENDEVLISGFGRRGKAKGDIPGVRFKIVKVSGVGLLALWKEKKVRDFALYLDF